MYCSVDHAHAAFAEFFKIKKLNKYSSICLNLLWHRMYKTTVLQRLFNSARPNQLAIQHSHIRAAVAHILGAVLEDINRLNDHNGLVAQPLEKANWIRHG